MQTRAWLGAMPPSIPARTYSQARRRQRQPTPCFKIPMNSPTRHSTTPPPTMPSPASYLMFSNLRLAPTSLGYLHTETTALQRPFLARPPTGIDISAVEINTFYPSALQHPDVAMRLSKAGWTRKDLAKVQLNAINNLTQQKLTKSENRIQKQTSAGGKAYFSLARGTRWSKANLQQSLFNDLTAGSWRFRHHYDSSYDDLTWKMCHSPPLLRRLSTGRKERIVLRSHSASSLPEQIHI